MLCYRLYSCVAVICICSVIVCVVLCIEIVRNTTLPPCVNPIAVVKYIYMVSHELRLLLRESVPYVKLYRYNPKHLFPKLNGYGGNGQRKVWTSCISASCTSTALSRIDRDRGMRYAFL